jgi:outer membrane lipoprotein-sorting protein
MIINREYNRFMQLRRSIKMKTAWIAPLFLILWNGAIAQQPSGKEILEKIDTAMDYHNSVYSVKMIVHGRRGTRTIEARSWVGEGDQGFTEYLAPPREKGTKMLKLEDQLWTYSPSTDRIIRISGHMLRQSVMGSDLSYEDMMEDPDLSNIYNATVVGQDTAMNRTCWLLDLKARVSETAYYQRKIWVDPVYFLVLKENLYAKSGKLLKTNRVRSITQMDGRWLVNNALFKDMLKSGKGTEFIIESIDFDAEIPKSLFNKASLRR